jgi:hypothetical protein
MKIRQSIYAFGIFLVGLLFIPTLANADGEVCAECHKTENPGLYKQWENSQHGQNNVNCLDCHKAESTDADAFTHNGYTISVIVSPKDCATCHEQEATEFQRSYHSRAGQILPSNENNVFGAIIGGPAAVTVGCEQCHGSRVELDADKKPSGGWPNTGIGRVNPDGSFGSCTACHNRHGFSKAQARTPEACAKCHLGPDHPQIEIYTESKHGNIYYSGVHDMNLDSDNWVAGVDYSAAPTCATCHIGAAPGLPSTHDMDERLSVNLRAKISHKINLLRLTDGKQYDLTDDNSLPNVGEIYTPPAGKGEPGEIADILTWENRRDKMKTVCKACHSPSHTNKHYENLDDFVDLYNNKFAKPISATMADLAAKSITNKVPFDEKIEWLWWEIWHHEGRRARSGAAMMGSDYAWWHGIYEVAKRLYIEFIPEVIDMAGEAEGWALLNKHFKPIDEHSWYFDGLATRPPQKEVVIINPKTGEEIARGNYATLQPTVENGTGLKIGGTLTLGDADISGVGKLIGKEANMVVLVINRATQHVHVLKAGGELEAWNGELAQLEALKTITFQSTQDIDVSSESLSVKGKREIYLGYRLGDDALMYFPDGIGVVVTE